MSNEVDDIFFGELAVPAPSAAETATPAPRLIGYGGALPTALWQQLSQSLQSADVELRHDISADTRFALLPADASRPFQWPADHLGGPALYFLGQDEPVSGSADLSINFLESASGAAIAARIRQTVASFERLRQLQQQVSDSTHVAMHAMSLNAELGRILEFVEKSYQCHQLAELAQACLACIDSMQLSAVIGFTGTDPRLHASDQLVSEQEAELIQRSREHGRIVDSGAISLFHYPHVSALIRDMPLADPERYGVLKDHLCLLFNGLEARTAAIHTEQLSATRAHRGLMTAKVIQGILTDMDAHKRRFTQRSSEILDNLLIDLRTELSQLDLHEREEVKLQQLVEAANAAFANLFDEAEQRDKVFNDILKRLTVLLQGS